LPNKAVTAPEVWFVIDNLSVQATAGSQNALDTVIALPGVTSLTGPDLLLGAQGTGSTISLTAASANLSTTASTNASAVTTTLDDGISATAAFMIGSSINGGTGNDTLTISTAPSAALDLSGTSVLVSVENISLTAGTGTSLLTLPSTASLVVTNASSTAASVVTLGAGVGQTFTASGSGTNSVTLGAAGQRVTGSSAADIFTTSTANALGSSFAGGGTTGTNDTLNFSNASTGTITITAVAPVTGAVNVGTTQVTGMEILNFVGSTNTVVITQDQALTINASQGGTQTVTANGTGTITLVGTSLSPVNVAGTSNFIVSGMCSGLVTSTQTAGTLQVTLSGVASTVCSPVETTVNATAASVAATLAGVGNYIVTGAGAITMTLTEAASHTTGSLTITSGSEALTIVEDAAGTGAVTINVAGVGSVSLSALATHASHTINISSSGTTTLFANTTATAISINATSTATAHTYVNNSSINSIDTYIGNSAVDNVTLGLGADKFTTGGGADVFRISDIDTQTGIVSGFASGVALPAQGTAINVAGSDIITVTGTPAAFSVVLVQGASTGYTVNATSLIVRNSGVALGDGTSNDMAAMNGSYSSTTGLFTISNAGADTLLVYDDNGQAAAGNYRGVVLVGYVDTGGADTFTRVSGAADVGTATYLVVL